MKSDLSALAQLFEAVPADLVAYFDRIADGSLASLQRIELNLLPPARAAELTTQFLEFHPTVQALSGLVLDDGNTSNHHVYLAASPLMGMVLFLPHDGDARVMYSSLADFVSAARRAKEQKRRFSDIHPPSSPIATDQAALSEFVRQQLEAQDGTGVITAVIPSMDLADLTLLRRLATDADFFLGEAIANEITKRPANALREIAELCSAHRHPQVANAGRRALQAVAMLN
jgi:hypothetical protein